MAWIKSRTAGLVIGILLLIVAIAGSAVFYYRRCNTSSSKVADIEADVDFEALSSPSPNFALTDPTINEPSTGTVHRQTGRPQTFYDWVQSNNEASLVKPSLDHGPSPVINSRASSMYSWPTQTRTTTTTAAARSGTRDSMGASSLRKAVLGAADGDEREERLNERKDIVVKETKMERTMCEAKPRGYSGAWP